MIRQNSIKDLLRTKGMTQKSLCDLIGQDPVNFNKIINNKRGLEHDMANKVAKVLGVQWFQVYENMNTEIDLHGVFNNTVTDNRIKMFDPVLDNKYPPIVLNNYVTKNDEIICIIDVGSGGLFIMLKEKMAHDYTLNGMYFCKLKNGDTKFIMKSEYTLRQVNPNVPVEQKTYRQKPKIDYCIPVSRVDYDWSWVDDGALVNDKTYPAIKMGVV